MEALTLEPVATTALVRHLKQLVQLDELAQGQVEHLVHVGNDG